MNARWDLVVLGGGTAGIVGAKVAANFGASVLLIERDRTGGDCLWTGCVPSKSLLAAAHAAAVGRSSAGLGVTYQPPDVDFAAVMNHVRSAIATIEPIDSPQALNEAGVDVLAGTGVLTGPRTVQVTEVGTDGGGNSQGSPAPPPVVHDIEFEHLLVSTGAEPALPPIPGLADSEPLTSDSVWELSELPRRLAVLGGGSIGCELGQAFARLGSDVTIVEGESRLIPREDDRSAAVLTAALEADGVTVRTGATVTEVHPGTAESHDGNEPIPRETAESSESSGAGTLVLDDGSAVEFDRVLVAVGRRPRTQGIGLDRAGVEVDERTMVVVDSVLRTTNERIFSAGDLTGHAQFTHLAGNHGSTAATNAVLGTRRKVASTVPRVTFTDPEIAAVGVSTQDVDPGHHLVVIENAEVDRAVAEGRTEGFTALVHDKGGTILGATVVGPRAGETLGELTLAVSKGLKTTDLAGVIHPYPTYSDGPWKAALADVSRRLDSGLATRAIGILSASRRKWLHFRD
ncbi:MAG: FAD-dependent oxidoreductase [Ornithinimicrobium sp.]